MDDTQALEQQNSFEGAYVKMSQFVHSEKYKLIPKNQYTLDNPTRLVEESFLQPIDKVQRTIRVAKVADSTSMLQILSPTHQGSVPNSITLELNTFNRQSQQFVLDRRIVVTGEDLFHILRIHPRSAKDIQLIEIRANSLVILLKSFALGDFPKITIFFPYYQITIRKAVWDTAVVNILTKPEDYSNPIVKTFKIPAGGRAMFTDFFDGQGGRLRAQVQQNNDNIITVHYDGTRSPSTSSGQTLPQHVNTYMELFTRTIHRFNLLSFVHTQLDLLLQ